MERFQGIREAGLDDLVTHEALRVQEEDSSIFLRLTPLKGRHFKIVCPEKSGMVKEGIDVECSGLNMGYPYKSCVSIFIWSPVVRAIVETLLISL